MITRAKLSHLGVPALKVRRFATTIKGEKVERALAILDLQPSPTCQYLSKLLRSAVANAVNNLQLASEYLYVSNVLVDQGPSMKRIHPRARGRAYRVLKRSSHVTIELDLVKEYRGNVEAGEGAAALQPAKSRSKAPARTARPAEKASVPAQKSTATKKSTPSKKTTSAKQSAAAKKTTKSGTKEAGKAASKPKSASMSAKPAKEKE